MCCVCWPTPPPIPPPHQTHSFPPSGCASSHAAITRSSSTGAKYTSVGCGNEGVSTPRSYDTHRRERHATRARGQRGGQVDQVLQCDERRAGGRMLERATCSQTYTAASTSDAPSCAQRTPPKGCVLLGAVAESLKGISRVTPRQSKPVLIEF